MLGAGRVARDLDGERERRLRRVFGRRERGRRAKRRNERRVFGRRSAKRVSEKKPRRLTFRADRV